MNKKPSSTHDPYAQEPVLTAEDREWGNAPSTRRISASPERYSSSQRDASLDQTALSSPLLDLSTLPSISDCYLPQTTGVPSYTSSGTPGGQPSTASSTPWEKSSQPSGAKSLPSDAAERKSIPVATGFIDYFPDAIAAVAELSRIGNDQHNPGKPLHWDRTKSQDESDALMRHFMQRGTRDIDGARHSTKVAWRALALLQKEIEGLKNANR